MTEYDSTLQLVLSLLSSAMFNIERTCACDHSVRSTCSALKQLCAIECYYSQQASQCVAAPQHTLYYSLTRPTTACTTHIRYVTLHHTTHSPLLKGALPADLAPLPIAVAAIRELFLGPPSRRLGGASLPINSTTSSSSGVSANTVISPFFVLHAASVDSGIELMRTAAAKHGGSQIEVMLLLIYVVV
jgi:hypothetical protein